MLPPSSFNAAAGAQEKTWNQRDHRMSMPNRPAQRQLEPHRFHNYATVPNLSFSHKRLRVTSMWSASRLSVFIGLASV